MSDDTHLIPTANVICPGCAHNFPAWPHEAKDQITALRAERDRFRNALTHIAVPNADMWPADVRALGALGDIAPAVVAADRAATSEPEASDHG